MHSSVHIAGIIVLSLSSPGAVYSSLLQTSNLAVQSAAGILCPKWIWVNSRATDEPYVGLLPASVAGIFPKVVDNMPGGEYYEVPYPASPDVGSSAVGAKLITAYLEAKHKECPETKFLLWGYSQGATLVHWVLEHTEIITPDAVIAVLLQGDEFFIEGQSWSRGTAKMGRDRPGGVRGLYLPSGIPAVYASKTINICDQGDRVCSDDFNANDVIHQGYKDRPEDVKMMIEFAISKLQSL